VIPLPGACIDHLLFKPRSRNLGIVLVLVLVPRFSGVPQLERARFSRNNFVRKFLEICDRCRLNEAKCFFEDARPINQKMKPACLLALICCSTVFRILPGNAQEHVDVPLPPYDPPPTISHRSQSRPDETTRDSEGQRRYRHYSEAEPKKQTEKSYRYRKQDPPEGHSTHHRGKSHRHKHFYWPWQHH